MDSPAHHKKYGAVNILEESIHTVRVSPVGRDWDMFWVKRIDLQPKPAPKQPRTYKPEKLELGVLTEASELIALLVGGKHYIYANVPERVLDKFIHTLEQETGRTYPGTITGIYVAKNPTRRALTLSVAFPNPPAGLAIPFHNSSTNGHWCIANNALVWELLRLGCWFGSHGGYDINPEE